MEVVIVEQWALEFFSEFFRGLHHVPGGRHRIRKWGTGYCINYHPNDLSTFDFDGLTRLVLMSHRDCIRSEISGSGPGMIKLAIWKRKGREGRYFEKHPSIETAVEFFNSEK